MKSSRTSAWKATTLHVCANKFGSLHLGACLTGSGPFLCESRGLSGGLRFVGFLHLTGPPQLKGSSQMAIDAHRRAGVPLVPVHAAPFLPADVAPFTPMDMAPLAPTPLAPADVVSVSQPMLVRGPLATRFMFLRLAPLAPAGAVSPRVPVGGPLATRFMFLRLAPLVPEDVVSPRVPVGGPLATRFIFLRLAPPAPSDVDTTCPCGCG